MAFHIQDTFDAGHPISQVPAKWFNTVAKFLNSLVGGFGIRITKDENGTAIVDLDLANVDILTQGKITAQAATHGTQIVPDFDPASEPGGEPQLDPSGWEPYDDLTGDDADETPVGWERGKTAYKNGDDVDEDHPAVGCSVTVCTHRNYRTVGTEHYYEDFFSRLDFDENGILIRVVPCEHWFVDNV